MGKRVISSFPSVKDDRVKKPFAAFKQINFFRNGESNYITGEILNSDDIPINVAISARLNFKNHTSRNYYTSTGFQYNLSPKASSGFQIDLDNSCTIDSLRLESIEIYANTDVSERGYIHGGITAYKVRDLGLDKCLVDVHILDELTTEINIPAILVEEKDRKGIIWQTKLQVFTTAVRSGLSLDFHQPFQKVQNDAHRIQVFPIYAFINGTSRKIIPTVVDPIANANDGIVIIPNCFMSQEIYLQ